MCSVAKTDLRHKTLQRNFRIFVRPRFCCHRVLNMIKLDNSGLRCKTIPCGFAFSYCCASFLGYSKMQGKQGRFLCYTAYWYLSRVKHQCWIITCLFPAMPTSQVGCRERCFGVCASLLGLQWAGGHCLRDNSAMSKSVLLCPCCNSFSDQTWYFVPAIIYL